MNDNNVDESENVSAPKRARVSSEVDEAEPEQQTVPGTRAEREEGEPPVAEGARVQGPQINQHPVKHSHPEGLVRL